MVYIEGPRGSHIPTLRPKKHPKCPCSCMVNTWALKWVDGTKCRPYTYMDPLGHASCFTATVGVRTFGACFGGLELRAIGLRVWGLGRRA